MAIDAPDETSEAHKEVPALVLAAGRSSRMGAFKPLLPLGHGRVIEQVVTSLRQGGMTQIGVVIGYRADELTPWLETLDVTAIVNPAYSLGMFSSVQAGIRAQPEASLGCLVLPVDIPLVRPATVAAMLRQARADHPLILHPVFAGRYGHPVYISRRLFAEILDHDGTGGLRAVLARHADEARTIEVEDVAILIDMDTPKDYATLKTLEEHTLVRRSPVEVESSRQRIDTARPFPAIEGSPYSKRQP